MEAKKIVRLQDFGSTYLLGNATHAVTMYRAPSRALVFGSATVRWSWGLDAGHDLIDWPATPTDPVLQQATVNLLADMGVQPQTLSSGLQRAVRSTDTTPPNAWVTEPLSGAELAAAVTFTVRGTAADTGGRVAGVEVSMDAGRTWHPATGRTSWSYVGTVGAGGPEVVTARAVDDSGNLGVPSGGTLIIVPTGRAPSRYSYGKEAFILAMIRSPGFWLFALVSGAAGAAWLLRARSRTKETK